MHTSSLPGGRTGAWLVIVAVGALLVGLVAGPVLGGVTAPTRNPTYTLAADEQPPEHTISVTGAGKVTVAPDMATITLGVLIERPGAKAARTAAAEAMTKVVAAVRKLGIPDKDIQTSALSIGPVYNYPTNGSPRIRGYQVTNVITITVRDLDRLGDVLDDSVVAGATTVNGITFDVTDRTAAEAKAREAAVKDAKAKAEALASGVGVSITGVASISESVATPIWYDRNYAGASVAEDGASTPILEGTTDVTINVSVVFLIG